MGAGNVAQTAFRTPDRPARSEWEELSKPFINISNFTSVVMILINLIHPKSLFAFCVLLNISFAI
jgi:hypothetical protein